MASTRDFVSLGQFAKDADEVQEPGVPVRVQGEAYRNTSFTQFQQQIGKQFNVIPVSEDVNEQIYNQTQFTDLIDKKGIPGWSEEVTYNKPAAVHASDGSLYFNKRDNNLNIDPVGAINGDKEWWGKFLDAENLDNVYTSEVEGDEGARLVGVTSQPIVFPRPDPIGKTLQETLTDKYDAFLSMRNMEILAEVNEFVFIEDFPQKTTFGGSSFNIDTIDIVKYNLTVPADTPSDRIGYLTVNFQNAIPTPYIYILEMNPDNEVVFTNIGNTRRVAIHADSFAVADVTANSIKIGMLGLTNGPIVHSAFWPAPWGIEDPIYRAGWKVKLTCFTFN